MILPFASSRSDGKAVLASLALLVLLALPILGCKNDGSECDTCSVDGDCKAGLMCVNFNDESGNPAGKHCGSGTGATQCRVR